MTYQNGSITSLPRKFCSPFIKGQVIALDVGKEGEKFNQSDIKGDFNTNRFWLILNQPEFNNIVDARIICVPLSSLEGKMTSYSAKSDDGKVIKVPVSNITTQTVIQQSDRILFNSFNKLILIKMTQVKSFPIKEIIDKYRHVFFVPSEVMNKVDEYNKHLYGFSSVSDSEANYGAINRMGYQVHYTTEDSGDPLIRVENKKSNKELAKQMKSFSTKKDVGVKVAKSAIKRININAPSVPDKEEDEWPKHVLPDEPYDINKIVPGFRKILKINNQGEGVPFITSRFNSLLKLINIEFKDKCGITISNITIGNVNKAIYDLGITLKNHKNRKLVPSDRIIDIYNYIINSNHYYNLVEDKVKDTQYNYEADIKNILKSHMNGNRAKWTYEEVDCYLTYYHIYTNQGRLKEFSKMFEFNTVNTASYLRNAFGFKLEYIGLDKYPYTAGYKPPLNAVANSFHRDAATYDSKLVMDKYKLKSEADIIPLSAAFTEV